MPSSPLPLSLQSKLQRPPAVSRIKSFSRTLSILRNLIFFLVLYRFSRKLFFFLRGYGLFGSISYVYTVLQKRAYKLFLSTPPVRARVDKQVSAAISSIEERLIQSEPATTKYLTLPKEPLTQETLNDQLAHLAELKRTKWEEGKVSGAVYHGQNDLLEIQAAAMRRFPLDNPIHSDVFPAIRKMEAEIVAMVLALFNAPAGGAGATTSGGTESILMACLSARQKAYAERGVREPEIILPRTAHAAFHKASYYFNIKLHIVDCPAPNHQVSIAHVRRLINPNTILLVGSCPNYPSGIVDDIPALSRLATAYSIPLHVDCCLGSFLLPFLKTAGFPSPFEDAGGFDFRLPGVTSISVDTHKYGFAPKGNSVILYRNSQLRAYQYFVSPEWTGGVYGSPTMAGSRPGSLIAGCWASLMAMGEKGYIDACHAIVGTRITVQNAINEHPGLNQTLRVMGEPMISVVAFESTDPAISIYDIADSMSARGYHLNSIQNPPGLHVAVTLPMTHPGSVDELIQTLVQVVTEEKEKAALRLAESGSSPGSAAASKKHSGRTGQLYGVAGSLPDKTVVERLVVGYLDTLYKV